MSERILQPGTTTFDCQCKNKRNLIRTKHLVVYSGALRILFFEICTRNVLCRITPNTAYTIHVHDPLSWIPYQKPDNSQLRENPLFVTQKHTEQPSVGSLGTVISIMSTHKTSCSMLVVRQTLSTVLYLSFSSVSFHPRAYPSATCLPTWLVV